MNPTLVTDSPRTQARFFRRKQLLVPTWRGWLVLLAVIAALVVTFLKTIQPFLAVNRPVYGGVLVVEGWAPDYALEAAQREFASHHYAKLYVAGGPRETGVPFSEYKTYAEFGAAILLKLGMSTNDVEAVPAPFVRQDRTYTAATALQRWLAAHQPAVRTVHLISVGPHARRSRLLYVKALGRGYTVGITAIPERNYDPDHWWRSSNGFRVVTDEAIAYLYARLLFHPRR